MIKDGNIWVIWSESATRQVIVVDKYDHTKGSRVLTNFKVFSYEWKGGKNQQWYTRKLGSGWAIQNVETGDYLVPDSTMNLSRVTVSASPTPWTFNRSLFGQAETRE
ncbi:hypothetical protein CVT25_007363 [Psilocybe cyanescens]|uniref:Ricin B lectin domain-containing protein n=1 Tax=Psilocybe cyanescens TaxID=93625 RepID=A0A409XJE9_PSICY|nr:hypothetical protein CVT25_007363 [Psilocybe cyanescens]